VQAAIGFYKHFLGHILGILEATKPAIHKRKDATLVFVHKQAKGFWLPVETLLDYATIFSSHSPAPAYPLIIYVSANSRNLTWNSKKSDGNAVKDIDGGTNIYGL